MCPPLTQSLSISWISSKLEILIFAKYFFQKQVHNLWGRGKFCFRCFLPLARIAEKNSRLSDSLEAVQGAIDPPDPTLVLPLTANDFLYTRQAGTNGEECNTNSRLS